MSYTDADGNGSIDPANEIVEENNYYPFGLKHKGYNEVVSPLGNSFAKKFKYQGQELNNSLGYDMYEFELRHYDAAIGRFVTTDPYEQFHSPYLAMGNNPVVSFDPDGGLCYDSNGNAVACPDGAEFDEYRKNKENHINLLDEVILTPEDSNQSESDAIVDDGVRKIEPEKFLKIDTTPLVKATFGTATFLVVIDGPLPVGDVGAGGVVVTGLATVALLQATENFVNKWQPILTNLSYIPPPKTLPGFPGAQKVRRKNERARWHLPNGDIGEWDSQHGEVEVYDKTGKKHKGAYNPDTGKKVKEGKPGRKTDKK